MIHSDRASVGLQSASYCAPGGIRTVPVNIITSVRDAMHESGCAARSSPQRERTGDGSILAPFSAELWMEYICIMGFHTFPSL